MRWDALPEVRSPAGRMLDELLEEGPRRQELPGYEPVYRDFIDYILRCTHRIWEQKNVGLCRSHYAADCKFTRSPGRSPALKRWFRTPCRHWVRRPTGG